MANIWHIYRREIASYFTTPIAYVVMTLFLIILGVFFINDVGFFVRNYEDMMMSRMQMQMSGDFNINATQIIVGQLFFQTAVVLLFVAPMITMRLFSEEHQLGTIELLLTAPVRHIDVIIGKFLACVSVFVVMLVLTFAFPIYLSFKTDLEMGPILSGYFGLFMLVLTFSGIGLFFSSLTENQIVAAALTFATLLCLWLLAAFVETNTITGGLAAFVRQTSLIERFQNFAQGVINLGDVLYYLTISAFGLFLTINVLDTKVH
jgi:ABC-2 type transport system permease protein